MLFLTLFFIAAVSVQGYAAQQETYELENPLNEAYLKKKLKKQSPRLILNSKIDRNLKKKLKTDPVVKSFYQVLKADAGKINELPLLERVMRGRRMSTAETRIRLSTLGMVYHLGKDPEILDRLNREILAVCTFPDWNPSHYLDVAGTALAVALAIDWAGEDLPQKTVELAKEALIEKGILPSFNEEYNWWVDCHHNWNQVCHAGMVGAAIVVAEKDPQLAAKTIGRALDNMGLALVEYGPDGVYPEGATYWGFGTMHTIMTVSMLNSAFGNDFGISNFPGFMESADFVPLLTAPSGEFYNFYDCGSNLLENNRGSGNAAVAMFNRSSIAVNLLWFALQTGNSFYFDESYFTDQDENRRRQYFDAAALVWLSRFEENNNTQLPSAWKGEGLNPLVIFRGETNDPDMFYLGAKGGKASNNHGNMDAGSFIFELDGIRWSIDLGNQSYNELEQAGFDLWNNDQDSERWTLLTKSNFGHSTISVNNQLHFVDGKATITNYREDE
ncbi:MAG: heparinase II/III family protein, partial [Bacteroidales bacterium]|nr:heparinase II/III family protein [Bacteroidales bacterium]